MPTRAEHLEKSEHTDRLSTALQSTTYTDWSVTSLFYSALHLIDAWLDDGPLPAQPKNHFERKQRVRLDPFLRAVSADYTELEERSKDARYNCVVFTVAEVEHLRRMVFEPLKVRLRGSMR